MLSVLPDDRERLAPVALPGEEPVPQFIAHVGAANAVLLQPGQDFLLRLGRWQAVYDWRIERHSILEKTDRFFGGFSRRLDYRHDLHSERARKFQVALVVTRHSHDRAGAVSHQ